MARVTDRAMQKRRVSRLFRRFPALLLVALLLERIAFGTCFAGIVSTRGRLLCGNTLAHGERRFAHSFRTFKDQDALRNQSELRVKTGTLNQTRTNMTTQGFAPRKDEPSSDHEKEQLPPGRNKSKGPTSKVDISPVSERQMEITDVTDLQLQLMDWLKDKNSMEILRQAPRSADARLTLAKRLRKPSGPQNRSFVKLDPKISYAAAVEFMSLGILRFYASLKAGKQLRAIHQVS